MGCMYRLLPLPAHHSHPSFPPVVNALLHGSWVTQGVVFAEEEQRWCSNRAAVENLDAVVVEVCCVFFQKPKVKQGSVFDQALDPW